MGVEDKAKTLDIKGVTLTLIISSFGFVMALFWRDAIKDTITAYIPQGEGLAYQYVAAIIVTIIAVIAIYIMSKYSERSIIRETVVKGVVTKEGREKTKKRLYGIDNKLVGRDISFRKKPKKK